MKTKIAEPRIVRLVASVAGLEQKDNKYPNGIFVVGCMDFDCVSQTARAPSIPWAFAHVYNGTHAVAWEHGKKAEWRPAPDGYEFLWRRLLGKPEFV